MLEVTWEWIALDEPALDVANTVAVEKGVEHDLLAPEGEFARWAEAAAGSPGLGPDEAAALAPAKPGLLELRGHIRAALQTTATGCRRPRSRRSTGPAADRPSGRRSWPVRRSSGVHRARRKSACWPGTHARRWRSSPTARASCASAGRRRAACSTGRAAASNDGARSPAATAHASRATTRVSGWPSPRPPRQPWGSRDLPLAPPLAHPELATSIRLRQGRDG